MPKDDEQDKRITSLEVDVGVLKTEFQAAERRADERHDDLKGTGMQTQDAIAAFRQESENREKTRLERADKKEERAAEERAAVFKSPKAWGFALFLIVAIASPNTVPRVVDYGAQMLGLDTHDKSAEDEAPATASAPPAVPE